MCPVWFSTWPQAGPAFLRFRRFVIRLSKSASLSQFTVSSLVPLSVLKRIQIRDANIKVSLTAFCVSKSYAHVWPFTYGKLCNISSFMYMPEAQWKYLHFNILSAGWQVMSAAQWKYLYVNILSAGWQIGLRLLQIRTESTTPLHFSVQRCRLFHLHCIPTMSTRIEIMTFRLWYFIHGIRRQEFWKWQKK